MVRATGCRRRVRLVLIAPPTAPLRLAVLRSGGVYGSVLKENLYRLEMKYESNQAFASVEDAVADLERPGQPGLDHLAE
jgi:hypothetical protein